ncbi:MAG: phosphoglycerol transferase, partial [Bradyrhizobium sp.]|nr:phosphoglycerol transferase [Bradyrhizobium sp.]
MPASVETETNPAGAAARGARFHVGVGVVAALHLAALAVLLSWEYGPFAITLSVLAWVFINCLFLLVLPRPGVAAALSLALVALLIVMSRFKFDILQLSLTFLDFLIVDRDTFSFLLSIFPRLRTQLIVALVLAVPLLWLIWR